MLNKGERAMTDMEYIKIAIDISKQAKYPYGAIVVKDDMIIGRSDSKKVMNNTPFCHAELIAIQDALKSNSLYGELEGASLYVSCEPCPMCMGAILYEKISKLVYGATLEDSNKYFCEEVLIPCEVIANGSKNSNISIKKLMRKEAVQVLRSANV